MDEMLKKMEEQMMMGQVDRMVSETIAEAAEGPGCGSRGIVNTEIAPS